MGLFYKQESYDIVGACMETHKILGCGFLEGVYEDTLEREFSLQSIPFKREKSFDFSIKGTS